MRIGCPSAISGGLAHFYDCVNRDLSFNSAVQLCAQAVQMTPLTLHESF